MPSLTTNFSFNKPLVNDPIDEDLWGGQLNTNWDSIDTIMDALTPIGSRMGYTGTTAPSSRWLLGFGQAVSRTTYAAYFALVSTSYGVGDGSTTFNMPDYRGRAAVGLDNLGGSSANRITDANADSLNNTGVGTETEPTLIGSTANHALTNAELAAHNHLNGIAGTTSTAVYVNGSTTTGAPGSATQSVQQVAVTPTHQGITSTTGSGSGHKHGAGSLSGSTGGNVQASIAEAVIIRVL